MDKQLPIFETAKYELTNEEKQFVYEPAEDSHILLDALEIEWSNILALKPIISVEIGCGCGLIACTLSKNLKNSCSIFAVDINLQAIEVTQRNASLNDVHVNTVVGDLLTPFLDRFKGNIDLIVFNPPYVPTNGFDEVNEIGILARAWCGGDSQGTGVLRRIFPCVSYLLSPNGIFYLVAIASNKIEELLAFDKDLYGTIILERKYGLERLYVLKFRHKSAV